jgi:hypothetical protein
MEDISTHECKYGHDVVQDRVRGEPRHASDQKKSLLEGLWVLSH